MTAQPHTTSKTSRDCESCHTSNKALGLGIDGVENNISVIKKVDDGFKLSSLLDKKQIDKLDRRGSCLSCHKSIPKGTLAISAMDHMAQMAEVNIDNNKHKYIVSSILNIGAWAQILGGVFVLLIIAYLIYANFIKKKPVNPRNEGWK